MRATLETLADRLSPVEAGLLAARLPQDLAMYLGRGRGMEQFSLDEFYERVGERARSDAAVASRSARAVLSLLSEMVGGLEISEARSRLPEEFAALLHPAV